MGLRYLRKGKVNGFQKVPLSDPPWQMLVRAAGGEEAALENELTRIRTHHSNPSGLTDAERLAVWIYSNSLAEWHGVINSQLWTRPAVWVSDFADLLSSALDKLPIYNGYVYRGYFSTSIEDFVLNYYINKSIVFNGFTSSSINQFEAFEGNVFYIIFSRSGRILGRYADNPAEEEVLFKPATWFTVTRMQPAPGLMRIWLDEVAR